MRTLKYETLHSSKGDPIINRRFIGVSFGCLFEGKSDFQFPSRSVSAHIVAVVYISFTSCSVSTSITFSSHSTEVPARWVPLNPALPIKKYSNQCCRDRFIRSTPFAIVYIRASFRMLFFFPSLARRCQEHSTKNLSASPACGPRSYRPGGNAGHGSGGINSSTDKSTTSPSWDEQIQGALRVQHPDQQVNSYLLYFFSPHFAVGHTCICSSVLLNVHKSGLRFPRLVLFVPLRIERFLLGAGSGHTGCRDQSASSSPRWWMSGLGRPLGMSIVMTIFRFRTGTEVGELETCLLRHG